MGKLGLLFVAAFIFAGGFLLFQSNEVDKAIDVSQSARQSELLARELAHSGLNEIIAAAKNIEDNSTWDDIDDFMSQVDYPVIRQLDNGKYKAWLEAGAGGEAYFAKAEGYYYYTDPVSGALDSAYHLITTNKAMIPTVDPATPVCGDDGVLCVECAEGEECAEEYELHVTFIESQAGWCSAIFLQQYIPDPDSESGYTEEIGLVFDSGKNRDGQSTTFSQLLVPGTQMNFILAADADCSEQGDTGVVYENITWTACGYPGGPYGGEFCHSHPALEFETGDITDMTEGTFAMVEQSSFNENIWRIAFEDLEVFSVDQHNDIKINGYGNEVWELVPLIGWSYGGDGWNIDVQGYRDLEDWGNQPDYSDQVIEIELVPVEEEEEEPA